MCVCVCGNFLFTLIEIYKVINRYQNINILPDVNSHHRHVTNASSKLYQLRLSRFGILLNYLVIFSFRVSKLV